MRLSPIALSSLVVLGFACDKKTEPSGGTAGQKTGTDGDGDKPVGPKPTIVKKPIDKTPLPPLAADPGGATGKPKSGLAFGGLGVDTPKGIALAADGSVYVVGYFDGEMDTGPGGKLKATEPDPPQAGKKVTVTTDAFLVKIGPDGKIAWSKRWGAKRFRALRARDSTARPPDWRPRR